METKHTQGEWRVIRKMNVKSSEGYICSCGGKRTSMSINNEIEMNTANAKLISAAPDLLNALRSMLSQLENEHVSEFMDEFINEAKEAIEKALK